VPQSRFVVSVNSSNTPLGQINPMYIPSLFGSIISKQVWHFVAEACYIAQDSRGLGTLNNK